MWKDAGSWQALASLIVWTPLVIGLGWNAYRPRPEETDADSPVSDWDVGVE